MTDPRPNRRLAAILAADVVGYSAKMNADEVGTQRGVSTWIDETVRPLIAAHHGRVVKLMGDGVLAEFASVVDAVACAVAWQQGAHPEYPCRIGVNLGDVIVEGEDIFGEGVNVAARLEGVAEAGGICISDIVQAQVRRKLEIQLEDLGEMSLKNIPEPLRVWRIAAGGPAASGEALPLPDKPSIAVLPFDNMSADPDYAYLADGISEDLITALSKVRWFFVIARNSTFTYKGQAVDITRVGRELGVKYVMEGSVRKAGNRVRITAQLIDAATGRHVWAERYDREIADIFDLQDEMTQTIIGAVEPEISAVERAQVSAKAPETLDAWQSYQRGVYHMWSYSAEDHQNALDFLTRATDLDPGFAPAHAYLAYVHYQGCIMHWSDDFDASLNAGMVAARRALAADERDAVAYFALGRIEMMQGNQREALAALETSVALNPSFAQAYHGLSMALVMDGQYDAATAAGEKAERLSPRDPIMWATFAVQAFNCILSRDFEKALVWAEKTLRHPNAAGYWPHAMMAASLARLGRTEEAARHAREVLRIVPEMSLKGLAGLYKTTQPDALEPYLEGLRIAGIPEG